MKSILIVLGFSMTVLMAHSNEKTFERRKIQTKKEQSPRQLNLKNEQRGPIKEKELTRKKPIYRKTLRLGGHETGGGDIIYCNKGYLLFKYSTYFLADLFGKSKKASIELKKKLEKLNHLSEASALEAIFTILNKKSEGLGDQVRHTYQGLVFNESFDELPELDDDFIEDLPRRCHKRQLAIQDLNTNIVNVVGSYIEELYPFERALFRIHETFIAIRNSPGDTSPIRAKVKSIINNTSLSEILYEILPKAGIYQTSELVHNYIISKRAYKYLKESSSVIKIVNKRYPTFESFITQKDNRDGFYKALNTYRVRNNYLAFRIINHRMGLDNASPHLNTNYTVSFDKKFRFVSRGKNFWQAWFNPIETEYSIIDYSKLVTSFGLWIHQSKEEILSYDLEEGQFIKELRLIYEGQEEKLEKDILDHYKLLNDIEKNNNEI